MSLTFAACFSL